MSNTYNDKFNQTCNFNGGYLEPVFQGDAPSGSAGTGVPADPYDRSTPLSTPHEGCGLSSRN